MCLPAAIGCLFEADRCWMTIAGSSGFPVIHWCGPGGRRSDISQRQPAISHSPSASQSHINDSNGTSANKRHWASAGSMLGRRRRRRANIEPTLVQCRMSHVCWDLWNTTIPTNYRRWPYACLISGPTSQTACQHQINIAQTSHAARYHIMCESPNTTHHAGGSVNINLLVR